MRSSIAPALLVFGILWLTSVSGALPPGSPFEFELVQPDIFSDPGGQPNLWADVDGDADLDLFVGFRGRPNRLYLNERGRFRDVAAERGLADAVETRAAAWGDFDADGDPDLYVGFADGRTPARIYRNDNAGTHFSDVAAELGIAVAGVSRQPVWVDYDGDGDLDLFAAFRDKPNRLLRNDGSRFVDVSKDSGIDDLRKTVGAVWWDFDRDGDLDSFAANQEGDANGLFRNQGGRFTDVAEALGVAASGRPKTDGGVGPSLADFDLDGDIDLFVANYGPSALYRNENGRGFVDVAQTSGIDLPGHVTTSGWGDLDNDGWPDLYLAAFLAGQPHYRDWLFRNGGRAPGARRFTEALPDVLLEHDGTHGLQLVDFDADGALDLALTNNDPAGGHYLLRNAGAVGTRSLAILVTDPQGRLTRAGAEVRILAPGSGRLLAAGIVDSGSGYCSQNAAPVHLGVPADAPPLVDIEVTVAGRGRRSVTRKTGVNPDVSRGHAIEIRTSL
jgi:hypothetical protein